MKDEVEKRHLGICLLRMLLCFIVILCHFWNTQNVPRLLMLFAFLRNYAVPVFMLMSFYLTYDLICTKKVCIFKKRIWRLAWPQVGWTFIYWGIYEITENAIGVKGMLWQLFTGHGSGINEPMWYQVVAIVLSVVFFLVCYCFSAKVRIWCIWGLLLVSMFAQYSGINYALFDSLRFELKYPLGRTLEMVPYAASGCLLRNYNICGILKRNKNMWCIFLIGVAMIPSVVNVLPKAPGFGYSGFGGIYVALIIFTIVYLLMPFENVPLRFEKCILAISKYTLGIYCMHKLIGNFLIELYHWLGWNTNTFLMCLVIYWICFIVAFLITKIPSKFMRQLVE